MAKHKHEEDEDDFDFDDEEEEPKGKVKKKEIEAEDESEDAEVEEKPKKFKKPEAKQDRFRPFHTPERTGIIDMQTEKPIAEDIFSILALILNKVQRIEEAVI